MVEDLDDVFHALAHRARRDMLTRLTDDDLTIGQLAAPLEMSFAAASKHVKVLEHAGLVRRTVVGRTHVCRLEAARMTAAAGWLRSTEQHWNDRLDALTALFAADSTDPESEDR